MSFRVYVSLRYLPLLQSDGQEYIEFVFTLSRAIEKELTDCDLSCNFASAFDQVSLQLALSSLSQALKMRVVLLFDDAAHIGRERTT